MTTDNDTDTPINTISSDLLIRLNAFLSERAVISATNLSRTTLQRKRRAGEFPEPEEISEGRVGYRIRDIEAWLADPRGWSSQQNNVDT